ncbi:MULTISPECIES: galactofuranose ABC transporter, permease protein YjfF [unclassified Aureimonas]|uniref:galactofuranose ABC transporter, permease protein YjfF n=1 Tax=unclassified Aureimonas TaxID=2615206 RepID=UPI0006FF346A|nr:MULTISPECIES: galactofuranose ABC transporter, permease protein YjfF [unclassified Aureimonas]KQT57377.1 ABC transporter permease [Aureimonas sp. Leaf427]KQT77055.1 ABC transporter permease [Aureimonas sp. Leaf460]
MTSRLLPLATTVVIFLLAYALCAAQFPAIASTRVIANLFTDNAFLGIVAVGMTFVIISGGIDLSVGAVIAFVGVFLAIAIERYGIHPYAAFALALIVSAAFGAAMGALIHYFEIPAFIITLAGMFLARGAASIITTESVPINHPLYAQLNDMFLQLPGRGRLTLVAMIMLAVFAVGILIAHRTRFGRNVYALGGNPVSAELMGIPVARTTILIYMLSSLCAGIAGIVFSLYTAAGYSLAAVGVELDTIAAVVIGGTLLTGGSGFVAGTLVGVLIQGLIQTYITFDGTLSSWWTKIVIGILLFGFIVLQRLLLSATRKGQAQPAH